MYNIVFLLFDYKSEKNIIRISDMYYDGICDSDKCFCLRHCLLALWNRCTGLLSFSWFE